MIPEIRTILNSIGYAKACRLDRALTFLYWEPTEYGNRHFKSKEEAAQNIEHLRKLSQLLQNMPPRLVGLINNQSKTSDDWDSGRDPYFDVAYGVVELLTMAENESTLIWNGKGASRRPAAEDIAKHMAKIFVLGMGAMPGSGAKENGEPSGPFPTAVRNVFHSMGLADNFRRPCIKAVKWLKADEEREFNHLMMRRKANGAQVPLIDVTERN